MKGHRKDGTFRRGHKAASKGEPRKMWSGRLPERTHKKLRALKEAKAFGSQADAIASAVDALPLANQSGSDTGGAKPRRLSVTGC